VAAHDPPYQASACAAFPQDLFKKVKKALSIRGPTFIHVLAPCPPGWRYPSGKSVEMGRLAVRSGMWILYEREFGKVTINGPSRAAIMKPIPLEEYLAPQGRFRGISQEAVAALRAQADRTAKKLQAEEKGIC
jgi:pyruvate ferredoxin oxidoreductase beta subunit